MPKYLGLYVMEVQVLKKSNLNILYSDICKQLLPIVRSAKTSFEEHILADFAPMHMHTPVHSHTKIGDQRAHSLHMSSSNRYSHFIKF
jgi:hypothetical protein